MLEPQGLRETHTQPRESYILESDHIKCWNEETFIVEVRNRFDALSEIKGRSAEIREVKWLQHFTALLGEPPKTPPNLTLRKIQIAEHLDIPTGPFTHRNQYCCQICLQQQIIWIRQHPRLPLEGPNKISFWSCANIPCITSLLHLLG